jgi:hypothetical protein
MRRWSCRDAWREQLRLNCRKGNDENELKDGSFHILQELLATGPVFPVGWHGSYLRGERNGDKAGRGLENKVPIVAADSLDDAGQPIHVKVAKVETFSFAVIADWAQATLARGCEEISDGLACFHAVAEVECIH